MEIKVKRTAKRDTYTIGKMYVDGAYVCDTIEDKDRGLVSTMTRAEIANRKVYGKTAIPTGRYAVVMNVPSPKFSARSWAKPYKGCLPRLCDVPGFDGVLIHVGNTAEDSLGCILVGENKAVGRVINSTAAFNRLMGILLGARDKIWLTVE